VNQPNQYQAPQISVPSGGSGKSLNPFRKKQRNPGAAVGGFVGMVLSSALMYAAFVLLPAVAIADSDSDDDFEIDFEPGALVKLGSEVEAPEIPEKVVVIETRAEEEVVEETITEEEDLPPEPEPEPEPEEKPKPKPDKPPPEKKDKKLPTSKLPTKKNTPYDDKPTNKPPPGKKNKGLPSLQKGDPFGDPGGWADIAKDGDPWATAVMKALNNMPVGSYAGKGAKGDFRFQLTLCKDGSIKKVNKKGGALSTDGQDAVRLALEQLKLPRPPSKIAAKMKGSCAKIKYTFKWSASGVK